MEYKRLGDIATYINGYAFKPEQWSNKGKPIIRIQNLNNKDAEYNYFDGEIDEKYLIKKGDVLISWSASIGIYEWDLEDAYLNQHIFKVVFEKEEIDKKYFKFMVDIALNKAVKYMHGSTMKHITKKYFDNILVPVPSLDKQKKIAEVLDKAQSLIDKKKEQIELLDELVKSRFVEMFGDVLTSNKFGESILKEVADITSSKRIYANEYVENGIPFYRSKEIRELGENLKPSIELFISEEKYNLIKEKYEIPKKGDILIAAIGATIGYTWIVNTDEPFYYKDGNLLNISVNKNMNPIYLNHVLKILINNFKYREASGSAQLALTIDKVGKMEIPVPPIELQNEFAEFVTQIDSIRSKMEASLSELENNFNSLMQKAFKGELF